MMATAVASDCIRDGSVRTERWLLLQTHCRGSIHTTPTRHCHHVPMCAPTSQLASQRAQTRHTNACHALCPSTTRDIKYGYQRAIGRHAFEHVRFRPAPRRHAPRCLWARLARGRGTGARLARGWTAWE